MRGRTQLLCGNDWYTAHKDDYSQADIDSLCIELRVSGKLQARVQVGERKARGIVREIVKLNRKGD